MRRADRLWAVLVLVASFAGAASAADLPDWAAAAAEAVDLSRWEGEDAVIALEDWDLELKGGARSGTYRRVVRVLTEDGEDAATAVLVSTDFRKFSRVRVWVRSPDGRVQRFSEDDGSLFSHVEPRFYEQTTAWAIAPPGTTPGTVVAVEARVKETDDLPQQVFRVQVDVPVQQYTVSVKQRSGWRASARASGARLEERTDDDVRRWTLRDLPPYPERVDDSAPVPPGAMLALSYHGADAAPALTSWGAVAAWLHGLYAEASDPASLTPPGGDDPFDEAARRARELRYFSIALGWGGWVPRAPRTTLARGFGDCKDKAQLMVDLLRATGREAHLVLVIAPSDGWVPPDLPSPFLFDHAIAAVRWDGDESPDMTLIDHPSLGRLRLYDGTMSPEDPRDTSVRLEGAAALVVHPSTRALSYLPTSPPELNRSRIEHEWRVTADGDVEGRFDWHRGGTLRSYWTDDDGVVLQGRDLAVQTTSRLKTLGADVLEVDVEPIDRTGPDWALTGTYAVAAAVAEAGSLSALQLGPFLNRWIVPRLDPEVEVDGVWIGQPRRWSERVTVLDPGRRYVGRLASFEVANDVGRVALTIEAGDGVDGVVVQREVSLQVTEVAAESAADLEALRRGVQRLNRIVLLFDRDPESATTAP